MTVSPRGSFGRGARDVAAGARHLAARPRLWGWVAAPALLTLALLIALVWLVAGAAAPLVDRLTGWAPDSIEGVVRTLAWIAVVAGLTVAAAFVFVPVSGVIAEPFLERLSAAVEAEVTGAPPSPPFSLFGFLRDALVGAVKSLGQVAAALGLAVALFALSLVPVIGAVAAAVIGGWLSARGAAADCYQATLERRGLDRAAQRAYLARLAHRPLGLGAAVTALLFVPGVNLVAHAVGAVGATLVVLADDATASADRALIASR